VSGTDHQADDDPRPQPPVEPESWECCQSGCDPCVFDRYWEALARYEQGLADWNARRQRRNAV
jgi:hypothetical protein